MSDRPVSELTFEEAMKELEAVVDALEKGDVALDALVTHVFVHELAHHLGWSDDDIARIDRWWE